MDVNKPIKTSGTVSRVVSGRLVYVDLPAYHGTVAFTPEKLTLKQKDGTERHYRGEPFDDLGLKAGLKVDVFMNGDKGQKIVMETPVRKSRLFSSFKTFVR